MPRNIGTGIYIIPPDTEGIPDQTIESATYNTYIHDVETDLNNPRPIIAGGTGANDADEALFNLGGEKATQLVTNYDTHVWMPGSFRAAGSATAGPVDGHAFAGIVYINEPYVDPPTNANVIVSARDMNDTVVPSRVYVREKKANVWGSWSIIDASTTTFPPGGGLSATTITAAIQELDAEKASLTFVAATYAPIASPLFTGDARAPTPTVNDNDTSIATTAFVSQAVANGLAAGGGSVDALAYSGLQINGSFDIHHVGSVVTDGQHVCDVWKLGKAGTMAIALDQQLHIPRPSNGLVYSLVMDTTTGQASLGANDYVFASQSLEGWRIQRLAWGTTGAQPITIGFWSSHKRAGVYSVAISNGAFANRCYVAPYTQAVANVYQYNVITVPGDTQNGAWSGGSTNSAFTIHFTLAAGSAKTAPVANTWGSTVYYAAPGQINGVDNPITAGIFRITGVAILPGVVAIPEARSGLLMRPYEQELALCQRYYQKIVVPDVSAVASGYANTPITAYFSLRYPRMRIAPTITLSALSDFSIFGPGYLPTVDGLGTVTAGTESARLTITASASLMTAGHGVLLQARTTTAAIILDARL